MINEVMSALSRRAVIWHDCLERRAHRDFIPVWYMVM